ncbi:MAG: aminotransferase class I/II-fold pyridoxal phosphate-dependent enzyme, partial [Muribaculaceae bacterium]|nr:aminotransferase class I/II-fold pyridoxal phosphate-dependent enzyme [Muribaculaceae bacterium]
ITRSPSLIFSTALPPLCVLWSQYVFTKCLEMDSERARLRSLSRLLASELSHVGGNGYMSHIQAVICGDPKRAVQFSALLSEDGFTVLPIRTPTVPPGTDRLRLSLSTAITPAQISELGACLKKHLQQ